MLKIIRKEWIEESISESLVRGRHCVFLLTVLGYLLVVSKVTNGNTSSQIYAGKYISRLN